jgi:proteic killer suppression protein
VIASFKDKGTEDVFDNEDTKAARKICPREIWKVAQRKLAMIEAAAMITDLRMTPGNALEKLKRDRAGQQSIRINDQYRICFVWTEKGAEDVEITDYH